MLIYPAIDLQGGACVRLSQGRFESATNYGDPFAQIVAFAKAGARWVHIVDLDGARTGQPAQYDLIGRLARASSLKIQCGGGVRERAHVEALLNAGASRVVVGSAALKRADDVRAWILSLGAERICCAFDVKPRDASFEVVVHGWSAGGGRSLDEALAVYPVGTLKHALVTDVSRDGILSGPNVALTAALVRARPDLAFQASGGVSSLEDLEALRETGSTGAIVGRALYEKRFTLEDALAG